MPEKTVIVKIKRKENPTAEFYWNTFKVVIDESANITSVLSYIRENPITIDGMKVPPVAWEANCLEEVCGACTMLINKVPRQGCSTLVKNLPQVITLEPLTKFPVVRDLIVDRSKMFNDLKKVKAWLNIDGYYPKGSGLLMSPAEQEELYPFATCMTCGCCLEVCPQYNEKTKFVGAFAIGQVYLANSNGIGKTQIKERVKELLSSGGIADCGNAQNCIKVCPKNIPLTKAIAKVNAQVNKYLLASIFG